MLADDIESRDISNSSVRRNSKKEANYQSFRAQTQVIVKTSNSEDD